MSRRSGFTLIELLVVIAIIAILAAILFPVFVTAKAAGQRTVCQGDVKQLLQAASMYEDDYSGSVLPGCIDYNKNGTSWSDFDEFWCTMVNKYIRQLRVRASGSGKTADMRGVFVCQAAPPVMLTSGGAADPALSRPYGYNYAYLGGNPNDGTKNPLDATKPLYHKTSEITKSTTTIRFIENWNFAANGYRNGMGSMVAYCPSIQNVCYPSYVWPPGWHSGTSTVGWFDGHVTGAKLCPPRPGGAGRKPSDFTSVEQEYYKDDGDSAHKDPYFRLEAPKP